MTKIILRTDGDHFLRHELSVSSKYKMKKIISILLLMLYVTTSSAIMINMHYCSGKYSGLTLINFGEVAQCSCGTHDSTHRKCCSDKIICAKADSHKAGQLYRVSPNLSDFVVPIYFINVAVAYPQLGFPDNHYPSSGFIRSHSPSFLPFICTYRI